MTTLIQNCEHWDQISLHPHIMMDALAKHLLGLASYGMTDVGEVMETYCHLKNSDEETWIAQWAEDTRWIYDGLLERGIHCLIFDGPGQGYALRLNKLPFRYDWENVMTPVIDYAVRAFPETEELRSSFIKRFRTAGRSINFLMKHRPRSVIRK